MLQTTSCSASSQRRGLGGWVLTRRSLHPWLVHYQDSAASSEQTQGLWVQKTQTLIIYWPLKRTDLWSVSIKSCRGTFSLRRVSTYFVDKSMIPSWFSNRNTQHRTNKKQLTKIDILWWQTNWKYGSDGQNFTNNLHGQNLEGGPQPQFHQWF